MAEGRMLKRVITTSPRLAALKNDTHRLIYTWLIPFLDVEGRCDGDPRIVKGMVAPLLDHVTPKLIEGALQDMERNGLVVLYEASGKKCLSLERFEINQTNLRKDRESPSKIPPIPSTRRPIKKDIYDKLWNDFNSSGHICPVCQKQGEKRRNTYVVDGYVPFEIDHIVALSKGGQDAVENLHIICRTCNRSKGNSAGLTLDELWMNSRLTPDELPPNIIKENIREENIREDMEAPPFPLPEKSTQKSTIPTWIEKTAWDGFVEMRKKIRKPLTERAQALAIKKLEQHRNRGHDPNAILDQSTLNGWQDLYELKPNQGGQRNGKPNTNFRDEKRTALHQQVADEAKRINEEYERALAEQAANQAEGEP